MRQISTVGALAAVLALFGDAQAKDWESPEYKYLYQFPLPIPPVKQPKTTFTNPVTNHSIDYYEVNILPFEAQVYPNLRKAKLVGYDGISPGPTFRMEKGRESIVRFINNNTLNSAIHLHGSFSRAPWDGWAEDTIAPGFYKDYYYPNVQSARTLWYHDHAMDITAVNAYFGQAGAYILHDPGDDALGLPNTYGVDDIPLILSSKQYKSDGTLFSPAGETTSLYGDVIHVNGQPWPYFKVEPKKYRLRFLDSSVSRSFILYFRAQNGGNTNIPFQVIGSDAGLLGGPVTTTTLSISMAERYEVVFDFSRFAGQNVTLQNQRDVGKDKDYAKTDQVMRFVVSGTAVADATAVPAALRAVPFPPAKNTVNHHFRFERSGGEWRINDVVFSDVAHRVLANVPRGTVEVWELENSSGGWTHPIHVHLVDFKVVKRTGGKRAGVLPYEAQGLKDVVWLDVGETVTVEAHYAPWDGVYMFHCHNLVHEDHEMMAAFNVTGLADLGYNETSFVDPMEGRWRATRAVAADFAPAAIQAKVEAMARLVPYGNVDEVEQRLAAYWARKGGARLQRVAR